MSEIKDAATIVLIRNYGSKAFVLMGKRSETATFMPSKYVFPGGAWEKQDNFVPLSRDMSEKQKQLLTQALDQQKIKQDRYFAQKVNMGDALMRSKDQSLPSYRFV